MGFYQLLLVVALVTTASQSAQQVAGNEAETDEPMSLGEVPLDDEELDHGATEQAPSNTKLVVPEALQEQTKQAAAGKKEAEEKFATTTAAFTEQTMLVSSSGCHNDNTACRACEADPAYCNKYCGCVAAYRPCRYTWVQCRSRCRRTTWPYTSTWYKDVLRTSTWQYVSEYCKAPRAAAAAATPTEPTATIVTNGPSWTASQQVCTNREKQLCTFDQICPNGEGSTPVGGGSSVVNDWSAMLRADGVTNDWVHINAGGHGNCKPHGKYHGLPTWGLTNGNAYNNRVYCC